MYAFIEGLIEDKRDNLIVISNQGVGYEILVSANTVSNLPAIGEVAKIYTYLHVREDAFMLFGFSDLQEKNMFLELINVSGIGAKTAIGILSSISLNELITAIITGDAALLGKTKGIGKKTAERIVLELKGKFGDITLQNNFNNVITSTVMENNCITEAVALLVNMGLTKYDAVNLVKRVYIDGDSTETLIAKALRNRI